MKQQALKTILFLLLISSPCYSASNIPSLLGWIPKPVSSEFVCGGYYADPLAALINTPLPPMDTTAVKVDADQTSFRPNGPSLLIGNVTLSQPGRWVHADNVQLNRNATTGKITSATLTGNVVMREPGKIMVSDNGYVELQSKFAHFMHAVYRIMVSHFNAGAATSTGTAQDLNAWGKVNEIEQQPSGIIQMLKSTYTTCAPTSTAMWQVSAARIDLNRDVGRGYAYDAWLHVKGVPVFYTPYFNFPIDDRRQSGFLFPTMGSTTISGFSVSIPYYWNIAPNYDATITSRVYTKRGVEMGGLFRYLTSNSSGTFNSAFLPNDRTFADFKNQALQKYTQPSQGPQLHRLLTSSDNRGFFSWQNGTYFDQHWNSTINYNYVSDDYYYQDFGNPISPVPNQLLRQGQINYSGSNWNFTGELQGYQTLHPLTLSTFNNPYDHLPELDLNGYFPNQDYGLTYQLNNQMIYFQRSHNPGEIILPPNNQPVSAARINIQPGVSLPLNSLAGYATPNLQLALTHYNIGNQVGGYAAEKQRTLPIFDVDSGLYFDRDIIIAHSDYQQTLEPRLFYLFVPYQNQNSIPIFDTALTPFSYDSMFSTNRFSGTDRIGDANQVTLALTTRILDADSGAEKFRASIGDIFYFRNRSVTNCGAPGTPAAALLGSACTDPQLVIGGTSTTERTSPIAGELSYQFNNYWNTTANLAWDSHIHQTINGNWNFQCRPLPNHILNFNYNFVRLGDASTVTNPAPPPDSHKNDLNQVGFSFSWPLINRWSNVGGLTYNRSHGYPQTYFYGVQYDNCCWAVRMVAGRSFNSLNQNGHPVFNNSVYLQWQFKGLGTVGTQEPTSLLVSSIPGYQDSFQAFPTFSGLTS